MYIWLQVLFIYGCGCDKYILGKSIDSFYCVVLKYIVPKVSRK